MKLISWNVNGLRACMGKGFADFFNDSQADVFCIQETKLQEGQIDFSPEGYHSFWNYAEKKGYSGTAVFSKIKPVNVTYGLGIEEHDHEGRLITVEYDDFYLICVYVPNAQRELTRLDYRMDWEDAFRSYVCSLDAVKPVIWCGDLNVAHEEIDLKNPKSNRGNAGFTDQEREKMSIMLGKGFTDTFRYLYPDRTGAYSWWSYMGNARSKNVGWRIDYFCMSDRLNNRLEDSFICPEIMGSDHCPVGVIIK
ncbi:MAG: exodeoxyribonuclease III [Lachnospiraceae bacterium]|nr:exodeoxyribonuclease III [Lachnospiraceae bacterium]